MEAESFIGLLSLEAVNGGGLKREWNLTTGKEEMMLFGMVPSIQNLVLICAIFSFGFIGYAALIKWRQRKIRQNSLEFIFLITLGFLFGGLLFSVACGSGAALVFLLLIE